jgi:hypothetical protein
LLIGFGGTQGKLGADKDTYVSKVDYFTELVKVAGFQKGTVVLVTPSFSGIVDISTFYCNFKCIFNENSAMLTGNYALPYILTHPEMCGGLVAVAPAASGIVPQSRLKALQVPYKFYYDWLFEITNLL